MNKINKVTGDPAVHTIIGCKQGKTMFRKVLMWGVVAMLVPALGATWGGSIGHATAANQPALASVAQRHLAPVERGKIVGWPGGNGVIYPTVGFFGTSQIFAVGAVHPDGSFVIHYPAVLPVDMLQTTAAQCPTLRSSDPALLSNSTGNYLLFQHGKQIGATHAGSSQAIAAFTGIADGDVRTGFLYADRKSTQSGYCERTLSFGGYSVDFRQNLELHLHKGWNSVVAHFSIPQVGHIVSDLTVSPDRMDQRWFFFRPQVQP